MSQAVENMFSNIAPSYDRLNHWLSFGIDILWRKRAISALLKDFSTTHPKALDICAGTLDLSISFLKQSPESHVNALDFSQAMLDHGRNKLSAEQKSHITTICGDALKLPFSDQSFDVAFCAYGMRNLDDNKKGLEEIMRVLKPGGRVMILEFFRPETIMAKIFQATYGRYWLPFLGGLISGNKQAYVYLNQTICKYYPINDYLELMRSTGLSIRTCKSLSFGVSHFVVGEKK